MSDPKRDRLPPQQGCSGLLFFLPRPRLRLNIRFMTSAWLTLATPLHRDLAFRARELRSVARYAPGVARRLSGPSTVGSLACQTSPDVVTPFRIALTTLAASWGLQRPQLLAQAGCR